MEDDAEFEDEDSGHLCAVIFVAEPIDQFALHTEGVCVCGGNIVVFGFDVLVVGVVAAVAHVVFASGMTEAARGGAEFAFDHGYGGCFVAVAMAVAVVIVVVGGVEWVVADGHEFSEEEGEDSHQDDAFNPTIACNRSCEARGCESIVSWREEL